MLTGIIPIRQSTPHIIGAGKSAVQVEFQVIPVPCQKRQCMFFDENNEDCGMLTLFERLDQIAEKLGLLPPEEPADGKEGADAEKSAGQPVG
jgi:hypothetical protein